MLLYVSVVQSFFVNIPLYRYTTICVFINMLVWIWVVSSLSQLQIMDDNWEGNWTQEQFFSLIQ